MYTPWTQPCVRVRAARNKRDSWTCKTHQQQTRIPRCQHPTWTAMPRWGPHRSGSTAAAAPPSALFLDRICCKGKTHGRGFSKPSCIPQKGSEAVCLVRSNAGVAVATDRDAPGWKQPFSIAGPPKPTTHTAQRPIPTSARLQRKIDLSPSASARAGHS
ncbi:unnamed protein product [Ectocarpus sp. 4 AP-2014]